MKKNHTGLISAHTSEQRLINYLHQYLSNNDAALHYLDICVFHQQDATLAQRTI